MIFPLRKMSSYDKSLLMAKHCYNSTTADEKHYIFANFKRYIDSTHTSNIINTDNNTNNDQILKYKICFKAVLAIYMIRNLQVKNIISIYHDSLISRKINLMLTYSGSFNEALKQCETSYYLQYKKINLFDTILNKFISIIESYDKYVDLNLEEKVKNIEYIYERIEEEIRNKDDKLLKIYTVDIKKDIQEVEGCNYNYQRMI